MPALAGREAHVVRRKSCCVGSRNPAGGASGVLARRRKIAKARWLRSKARSSGVMLETEPGLMWLASCLR